jgi:hypothetical protein
MAGLLLLDVPGMVVPSCPKLADARRHLPYEGTVTSVAVDAIGAPAVIFWCKDSEGVGHQMNASLESEAVSRLGMLQLLRDDLIEKRDVDVYYTVAGGGALWFYQVRMF